MQPVHFPVVLEVQQAMQPQQNHFQFVPHALLQNPQFVLAAIQQGREDRRARKIKPTFYQHKNSSA